jgi:DNA-binding CsgD family transcriptional regulator
MRQTILIFGAITAAVFILFQLNQWSLWKFQDASNVFIVGSGVLFVILGFILSKLLSPRKKKITNPGVLSKQEHKVLQLMDEGLSNQEIAEKLFIAESTVKTHISRIFNKLNAKRRTEAIKIGHERDLL